MKTPDDDQLPAVLPWQESLWQQVIAAHHCKRLAHALLLSGPSGVGKRNFAQRLAGLLLCQRNEDSACGACPGCRQLIAGAHPGFVRLTREEGRRDISIDAVRTMCSALAMTSHDGRVKVAVLDPVDAMNQSGVNALLKTLEEPSGGVLILISEFPLTLPATLRSRCQILRFPVPKAVETSQWLSAKFPGSSAANRAMALKLSRGAPFRAVAFLRNPDLMAAATLWQDMMLALLQGRYDPIDAASRIDSDQVATFLDWLAGWARDTLCNPGSVGVDRRLLAGLGQAAFDAVRLIKSNVKPQLVIEALLIDMVHGTGAKAVARRPTLVAGGGL